MEWRNAIIEVLKASDGPMHYKEIAREIADRNLRGEAALGATPAQTVSRTITTSINEEGERSPFAKWAPGHYELAKGARHSDGGAVQALSPAEPEDEGEENTEQAFDDAGLINAFGMYWARAGVLWKASPAILGQQLAGSLSVDFADQRGVYMLHHGREVVYVGRATEGSIAKRLFEHTRDRLRGRWDSFSWFGVCRVTNDGELVGGEQEGEGGRKQWDVTTLIVTMEALLIEGLEPRQNRKRGDEFQAIEYIQVEDPLIVKERTRAADHLSSQRGYRAE